MIRGERINSFRELQVYQLARELDEKVFEETKRWPRDEKFALIDQIRRSSRAVGANLAEAWAKRRYPAHFLSKLTDADGELQETMHWLGRAAAYACLTSEKHQALETSCRVIGAKLGKMMRKPDLFC
jgi:four helix bundle protein